ncbi:MAG: VanZ family protein [Calditrichaeota bacterium]|nr:MAG: VanZ family protein [Calditrichota bacterium]
MNSYFLKFRLPVYLYLLLIFVMSSLKQVDIPQPDVPLWDKWIHFVEYAVLGFLLMRNLTTESVQKLKENAVLVTFFFGTFYGASDEIHQYFVPGRYCDFMDFVADTLGILLGIGIWEIYIKIKNYFSSS